MDRKPPPSILGATLRLVFLSFGIGLMVKLLWLAGSLGWNILEVIYR